MSATTAQRRLAAQLVSRPLAGKKVVDVVRRFGAMQGQDWPGTRWAVALRTKAATGADVDRAFAQRKIVRTWAFRGTLFFVAAEDAAWIVELVAERCIAAARGRHRQLGLDARVFARADDVLADALAGGKALGRRALVKVLEEAGVSPKGQRGIHMLWHASMRGSLVQVGFEKNEAIFMHARRALPKPRTMTRAEALDEMATRYLATRAPATERDLAWFLGLPLAQVRPVHARVVPGLPRARPVARGLQVHLLPGFDEMLLGYQDRSASIARKDLPAWWPGGGLFERAVTVDGVFRGTWKARDGRITTKPAGRWSAAERAGVERAAERYQAFLA